MKKIVRCIVEMSLPIGVVYSERDLVKRTRTALLGFLTVPYAVKGYNASMARERKKGKRERRRFEAGR